MSKISYNCLLINPASRCKSLARLTFSSESVPFSQTIVLRPCPLGQVTGSLGQGPLQKHGLSKKEANKGSSIFCSPVKAYAKAQQHSQLDNELLQQKKNSRNKIKYVAPKITKCDLHFYNFKKDTLVDQFQGCLGSDEQATKGKQPLMNKAWESLKQSKKTNTTFGGVQTPLKQVSYATLMSRPNEQEKYSRPSKKGDFKFIKYNLETYHRSNQDTCLIQKPALKEGDWVQTGDLLADSASSVGGELAIGHNIIVAYMPWEGYNYEDSILINERLVYEDIYTSIHIERYEVTTKDTKLGLEQITREIPDTTENQICHLDKNGIAKIGSWVEEGDILVGKVTPFNIKSLTPQQKLLYKIFDKELSNTKDSSLRAPKGIKANVIKINILALQKFNSNEIKTKKTKSPRTYKRKQITPLEEGAGLQDKGSIAEKQNVFDKLSNNPKKLVDSPQDVMVPSYIHIYLAEKRKMQVGDKMAGRHGNKGIVSLILPRQDMPFLPNGTAVDIVLNPLGVPSRMNVGQIYECILGLAGRYLGEHYKIPPFDEVYGADASRSFVLAKLYEARKKTGFKWLFDPNSPGKMRLFDGRTNDPFDQTVTVGVAYVLKLVHMVDDKLHARSTGPYSLVTQQPLRGRSKQGGQRLGEMEVWAIEGYGAAFVLSEMLTLKSDDMTGRQNLWKNLIHGNSLKLGTPESFKVLICELQALCLDIGLFRKSPSSFAKETSSDTVNQTEDLAPSEVNGSLLLKKDNFKSSKQLNNFASPAWDMDKYQSTKNATNKTTSGARLQIDSLLHLA